MTYDNTDTNADGAIDAPIDNDSVSTDELRSDAVTMFVRSTGSDSNDGLSESNAKATLQSAVEDAPINGDRASAVTVNIKERGVNVSYLSIGVEDVNSLKIIGATDGSGNPDSIIDGGKTNDAIRIENSRVQIENCIIKGGNSNNLRTAGAGYLTLENCTVKEPDGANCNFQGRYHIVATNSKFDATNHTTAAEANTAAVGANFVAFDCTFIGDNGQGKAVVQAKDSAIIGLVGGNNVIRGNGPSTTSFGGFATKNGVVKMDPVDVEDVNNAFAHNRGGTLAYDDTGSFTNVNKTLNSGGGFVSATTSTGFPDMVGLPVESGMPPEFTSVGGSAIYDDNTGLIKHTANASGEFNDAVLRSGRLRAAKKTSITVPAGGSTIEGTGTLSGEGRVVDTKVVPASAGPNTTADASVTSRPYWDDSINGQKIEIVEELGNSSIDVDLYVYRYPES